MRVVICLFYLFIWLIVMMFIFCSVQEQRASLMGQRTKPFFLYPIRQQRLFGFVFLVAFGFVFLHLLRLHLNTFTNTSTDITDFHTTSNFIILFLYNLFSFTQLSSALRGMQRGKQSLQVTCTETAFPTLGSLTLSYGCPKIYTIFALQYKALIMMQLKKMKRKKNKLK